MQERKQSVKKQYVFLVIILITLGFTGAIFVILNHEFQTTGTTEPQTTGTTEAIFSSGFETGNFDEWDSTWPTTPLVQSSFKHNDDYAMKCDTAEDKFAVKDNTVGYDVYLRMCVYFETIPTSGEVHLCCLNDYPDGDGAVNDYHVLIGYTGGQIRWGLIHPPWGPNQIVWASAGPTIGVWYRVELRVCISGSTVTGELNVNGKIPILTNSYSGTPGIPIQQTHVGGWGKSSACTLYIDDVVVDDEYIGT